MADSDLASLTAATQVDSDHLLYLAKSAIGSDRKVSPTLLGASIAAAAIEKSADFTAANAACYIVTGTCIVTDPTPAQAQGFRVLVRSGTATVGGTAYATAGTVIERTYHSGAWSSRVTYTTGAFGATLAATATRSAAIAALCDWAAVSVDTTLAATDRSKVVQVTVGATDKTITLPTLVAGDAGWAVLIFRIDRGYGKLIVTDGGSFSETIRIKGTFATYIWNGTAWYEAERHGPLENVANPNQFGSGIDGDATVSTGITLTGDAYYRNLTLATGGSITTSGYRIFVSGDLDLRNADAGAIRWNGANGSSATGATGGTAGSLLTGNTTGGSTGTAQAGATGVVGVGAQPTSVSAANISPSFATGRANAGGAGGAGGSGAGGASRTATSQSTTYQPEIPIIDVLFKGLNLAGGSVGQAGSSGAGDGAVAGGGGGANGKGGGMVQVYARRILVGSSTPADVIQAKGGNGGNGGTPSGGNCGGGGGGAGGSGGAVFLVAGEIVGSTTAGGIDVTGGNGGNGGTGTGTGANGGGGTSGSAGRAVILDLAPNVSAISADSSAGNAGSGATGGTATTTQVQIAEAP